MGIILPQEIDICTFAQVPAALCCSRTHKLSKPLWVASRRALVEIAVNAAGAALPVSAGAAQAPQVELKTERQLLRD